MNKSSLVCIVCPLGCQLDVTQHDEGGEIQVEGYGCRRGKDYAVEEITNPTRMVTSTVIIKNSSLARLPVKTARPIPKKLIFSCMEELNKVEVNAPVKVGDVIVQNLLGSGVDIVATRSVDC